MSQFTVIYDACVLYPAPLRDLLMHLAMTGLFRAKWTDAIHDEWIASLLKNRPDLTLKQLTRTRKLMDAHVMEAIVEGYEHRIEMLSLPDSADLHVLAAAIESKSSLIITWNLEDFPASHIDQFGITAVTPDEFMLDQIELSPDLVLLAVQRHKESLKNPMQSWKEYFISLESQGLIHSVELLRELIDE